jgi:hypothetical protein
MGAFWALRCTRRLAHKGVLRAYVLSVPRALYVGGIMSATMRLRAGQACGCAVGWWLGGRVLMIGDPPRSRFSRRRAT